ncbi:MAG: rubrerythrin family protein [bacterium]|nr:MAG: rubrerythrin family protein [bacterium]
MKKMTEKSLGEAFAGESMAHMKYLMFSEVAENEGYPNIARLFQAISYAEQVHATNHARNLGYIGKTEDNLQTGIDGETFEVDEMYPAYDAIAKLQDEKGAQKSIHFAVEAEKIHAAYYQEAREKVRQGKDFDMTSVYICPVCGYTQVDGDVPDKCPVCAIVGEKFKKF